MTRTATALTLLVLSLNSLSANDAVSRIAFGSCCKQNRPSPIFESINAFAPETWIWMGDNIYGDSEDVNVLREKWAIQKEKPGYKKLRESCTIIGTWDDHDYGRNDAGKEYPSKKASQAAFLDFLEAPANDPRRFREGVYTSHVMGPAGKQLKIILLDTRYHRDAPGEEGDILGAEQWKWLEQELIDSSANVHLLVSSIQAVASDHRYEKWSEFPTAKERLLKLLSRKDVPPVTILSGDRHSAEISVEKKDTGYPVFDVTSSSMNSPIKGNESERNDRRVGEVFSGANFGTLEIDWEVTPPKLKFAIRDLEGKPVRELTLKQEK